MGLANLESCLISSFRSKTMSSMPHCLKNLSAQPQWQTIIHAKRRRLSLSPVCHAASTAPKQRSLRQLAEAHRPKKAPPAGPAQKQQSAGQHKKAPDAQRLSKVLATAGVASRRGAEDLILQGKVKVNGKVVSSNVPITRQDKLLVADKAVRPRLTHKTWVFAVNKPKGYVCSSAPSAGEQRTPRRVVDLLDPWIKEELEKPDRPGLARWTPPRLFTVGRLDVQTQGLIFVTNNGQWANQVTHPSNDVHREYIVTTEQLPTRRQLKDLEAGAEVDGELVQPISVQPETSDPAHKNRLRIIVAEGRNREVRRLVAHVGLEVTRLKRVRVGGFRMPSDLNIGCYRLLKPHEVNRVTDKGLQNNPYN